MTARYLDKEKVLKAMSEWEAQPGISARSLDQNAGENPANEHGRRRYCTWRG